MGFGTLFVGYFFLINISYFSFTDIISAAVMLMGLYKLSRFNADFRIGLYICSAFTVFSVAELAFALTEMLTSAKWIEAISPYMSVIRYCIIFALNIFIMRGIRAIADEVAANSLSISAKAELPFICIYLIAALFSVPTLGSLIGNAVAYIYFAILIVIFAYVISALVIIYKAYMQICLPEDEHRTVKPSSFDPLGKLFDRMEKSGREYYEYKLQKQISKNEKQKTKKKKGK